MPYIHCCGALRRAKSFALIPADGFLICEMDILQACPVCNHFIIQVTRIDFDNRVSIIRKKNLQALKFFEKLKSSILFEKSKVFSPFKSSKSNFYLNYNEFGVKKRCYSNFSNLEIGKTYIYQELPDICLNQKLKC